MLGFKVRKKKQKADKTEWLSALVVADAFVFKNDADEIIEFSSGQREILACILNRKSPEGHKRIHIQTPTRYGKSATVAAGVLLRVAFKHEKWSIIAGTTDKAGIIMEYIIRYALDNEIIKRQLDIDPTDDKLERLKRERSRTRLTFRSGGEIRVFSADSRNKVALGNALMGFGSPNVVEDESALIADPIHAKVMRMLGDSKDNFLVKIGNPFNRNHFLKSYESPRYFRILVDWRQMLKENRVTKEFLDEMREEPFWDVFYEAIFPDEDVVDSSGWMTLITHKMVESAMTAEEVPMVGRKRMGQDVAGGGRNFNATVIRSANYAFLKEKNRIGNLMVLATRILQFFKGLRMYIDTRRFKEANVFVDKVGVGKGLVDRLTELIPYVMGVGNGEKASDPTLFVNIRAESYWRGRQWLIDGGQLSDDKHWYQLTKLKYKVDARGRIQIIPKEYLIRDGIDSPDVADAWALTFAIPEPKASHEIQGSIPRKVPNDDPFDDGKPIQSDVVEDDPYESLDDL